MANPGAVSYLKQYKDQYSLQSLKQALQQQGYTPSEIEEAVREVINPFPSRPFPLPKIRVVPNRPVLHPPLLPTSIPTVPPKKNNTWILVVVLLLLLPLLLIGCLMAIPMLFFAGTAATYSSYLPFLASLAKTESLSHSTPPVTFPSTPGSTPSAGNQNEDPSSLRAQAIDFHTLMQALPVQIVDGYASGKGEVGSVTFPTSTGVPTQYSTASNQYTNPPNQAKITLLDSAGIQSLMAMYGGFIGIEYERSDGYRRKTTIQGYPAMESYNSKNKKTDLFVIVKNRIFVTIESTSNSNIPIETLRDLANQVNYELLANSLS